MLRNSPNSTRKSVDWMGHVTILNEFLQTHSHTSHEANLPSNETYHDLGLEKGPFVCSVSVKGVVVGIGIGISNSPS